MPDPNFKKFVSETDIASQICTARNLPAAEPNL